MNTSYTYEVDAFDAFNNRSAKSDPLVVSTVNDADPPTVPQNLHSTGVTTSTISLAWDASSDSMTSVAGYTVYRDGTLYRYGYRNHVYRHGPVLRTRHIHTR